MFTATITKKTRFLETKQRTSKSKFPFCSTGFCFETWNWFWWNELTFALVFVHKLSEWFVSKDFYFLFYTSSWLAPKFWKSLVLNPLVVVVVNFMLVIKWTFSCYDFQHQKCQLMVFHRASIAFWKRMNKWLRRWISHCLTFDDKANFMQLSSNRWLKILKVELQLSCIKGWIEWGYLTNST